jgi:hypothetical protein
MLELVRIFLFYPSQSINVTFHPSCVSAWESLSCVELCVQSAAVKGLKCIEAEVRSSVSQLFLYSLWATCYNSGCTKPTQQTSWCCIFCFRLLGFKMCPTVFWIFLVFEFLSVFPEYPSCFSLLSKTLSPLDDFRLLTVCEQTVDICS